MTYDMRKPETVEAVWPAALFDANGAEIQEVISCDTETGWVEKYLMDGDEPVVSDGEIATVREKHAAPLQLVPLRN